MNTNQLLPKLAPKQQKFEAMTKAINASACSQTKAIEFCINSATSPNQMKRPQASCSNKPANNESRNICNTNFYQSKTQSNNHNNNNNKNNNNNDNSYSQYNHNNYNHKFSISNESRNQCSRTQQQQYKQQQQQQSEQRLLQIEDFEQIRQQKCWSSLSSVSPSPLPSSTSPQTLILTTTTTSRTSMLSFSNASQQPQAIKRTATAVANVNTNVVASSLSSTSLFSSSATKSHRKLLPALHLKLHWSLWSSWQRFLMLAILFISLEYGTFHQVTAHNVSYYQNTTPLQLNYSQNSQEQHQHEQNEWPTTSEPHLQFQQQQQQLKTEQFNFNGTTTKTTTSNPSSSDSIFMRFAKRFSTGNELWDGIIRDCYSRPSFTCFQKNVYMYLNGVLDSSDMNVTQRLKFYKNNIEYQELAEDDNDDNGEDAVETPTIKHSTQSSYVDTNNEYHNSKGDGGANGNSDADDDDLLDNEIPNEARAAHEPATPIEEITTALYGKSIKFAMTHDVEIKLPETLFDGATFRISPRSLEGNGIIAKLELIPKQEIQARFGGKIIMNKIKKFLRSKILLSFLALVLIIKIIKIKLFWLLPLVIGVGAAKKLLLKFLLFLFPALSHLFKLCSYYQQTYHSTKYHHHHHLIDHHHTIVPPWHHDAHNSVPEIIYTKPPKGHISAYLNGAPIHEHYGPPSFEHQESNWESSGPGLGSEYINDINRNAHIEENSSLFKPNQNDANILNSWGLGSALPPQQQQQLQQQQQQQQQHKQQQQIRQRPLPPSSSSSSSSFPQTQQQKPPIIYNNNNIERQQILTSQKLQTQLKQYQKPHAASYNLNPFLNVEKPQSHFSSKYKVPFAAQSAPHPIYTTPRNGLAAGIPPPNIGLTAAQIAAQYDPSRNNPLPETTQQQISPEVAAQIKEALRIQTEQRIIAQQQKILDKQPFVQDGQPILPKNYDPFYSPILMKIDKIVEQLGVTDDYCKERIICSMYKDPTRYSPHSNFVSAELSRDTSELQTVTSTNPAVLRFYRFIQAARDGQDQKDCLSLYSHCNINTE